MSDKPYIGRFAPSPSGALHFGSLVAALGSYLDARSRQGHWWVRIEDIDPPREIPGAADTILFQLEHYGLLWDGDVLWQSQRRDAYLDILSQLRTDQQSYYCHCSRRRIRAQGGYYDGYCRYLGLSANNAAVRFYQQQPVYTFNDQIRGDIHADPRLAAEDFIIHRRDGLFAYNLAVVVDDHYQGVNYIVRGADLIEPTVRQISLYQQLGWPIPAYLHLPLVITADGNKLSKQNHAPPLPQGDPRPLLVRALAVLGQTLPADWQDLTTERLLAKAVSGWDRDKIPVNDTLIPDESSNSILKLLTTGYD